MHESPTVLVAGQPTRASASKPSERPRPAPPPARRVTLTPVRKLTRAHLALAARPAILEEASAVLMALAPALSQQLGTEVRVEARLADATLHPLTHLAAQGVFALFEVHGDGLALLELDPLCVSALLQHAAGGSGTLSTPVRLTRIEEAALGWQLLSTLSQLRKHAAFDARFAPRLISIHFDRAGVLQLIDGRRRHLAFGLSIRIGDTNGSARLLISSTWMQQVLEPVPPGQPEPLQPAVASATLEAACLAGRVTLGAADAEALTPGDVLLFPSMRVAGGTVLGPGRLTFSSFELRGSLDPDGFTLIRASERTAQENPMSDVDPTLPVEVEVELTRLRIPLHELGALKAGGVLPLHVTAAQTVVLRIGDRAVARAELVEVDGEIGARILSLL